MRVIPSQLLRFKNSRLFSKLKKLEMDIHNNILKKSATSPIVTNNNNIQESSSECSFNNGSVFCNIPSIDPQESRRRRYGQAFVNNPLLNRFNQSQHCMQTLPAIMAHRGPMSMHNSQRFVHDESLQAECAQSDDFVYAKPLRKWVQLNEKSDSNDSFAFKIMSYNVLAQDLLEFHRALYPKSTHKSYCLEWKHRWNLLKEEFQYHKADIICLQEVQESHFKEFYTVFFKRLGYSGIYKQRTGGSYPDGCAIFYKTKVLELVEQHSVEYFQPRALILNRDNVAIVAKFRPRNLESSFVVATTHLLFNPKREDVRLAQTQVLLAEINRLSYDYHTQNNVPVIICGDFNSPREVNNGVFQLITEQLIDYSNVHMQRKGKTWLPPELGITNYCKHHALTNKEHDRPLSRSEEEKLIRLRHSNREHNTEDSKQFFKDVHFHTGTIIHDFNFQSVYADNDVVSTNQNQWKAVDYLFYSTTRDKSLGQLKCLGRYELPTEAEIKSKGIKGIPNCKSGSDHFSLVAAFQFTS